MYYVAYLINNTIIHINKYYDYSLNVFLFFLSNYFNFQWDCLYCIRIFWSEQKISVAHTYHIKKESELDWDFKRETDQCSRIQCSFPLHFITASLSSAFDSGAHTVLLFSVTGYIIIGVTRLELL